MGCGFTFRESGGFGFQLTQPFDLIISIEHISHATLLHQYESRASPHDRLAGSGINSEMCLSSLCLRVADEAVRVQRRDLRRRDLPVS